MKEGKEVREKKSKSHIGLKHSEETKVKIKLSNKVANFKYRYSDLSKLYPQSFAEFFPDKDNGKRWMQRPYAAQIVKSIKSTAKKRKLLFEIDDITVFNIIHSPCHYCGFLVEFPLSRNGLDRIDNSLGYIADNVVSCCWICNRAKRELSLEEFNEWSIRRFNNIKK